MSSAEKPASKPRSKLDQVDKRLLSDILAILVILLVTIAAFWRYPVPGVLLAENSAPDSSHEFSDFAGIASLGAFDVATCKDGKEETGPRHDDQVDWTRATGPQRGYSQE